MRLRESQKDSALSLVHLGNPDKDSYRETVAGIRKSFHQIPGVSREKLIVMHASGLRPKRNLTAG